MKSPNRECSAISEAESHLAFFYEYGRDSETVKREVEKMRADRPRPHIWRYIPRGHHLCEAIEWLALQDSFPAMSWLELRERTIREMSKPKTIPASALPPGIDFQKLPAIALPQAEPPGETDWMACGLRGSNVDLRPRIGIGRGPKDGCPERSLFEIAIDWRLSDAEISEMLVSIIRGNRPVQFKKFAKLPRLQAGYDSALPFRKNASLQWLATLRQYGRAKNWRKFFRLYVGRDFHRGAERPYQENVRKAKLILAWFDAENTEPLSAKDFA